MPDDALRIAVLGDVHGHWDEEDRRWFDRSDYHLLLFVGDLTGYLRSGLRVACSVGRLAKPALVMPGNHDGVSLGQLGAEVFDRPRLAHTLGAGQLRRVRRFERCLGAHPLVGYSLHELRAGGRAFSLVAARPHSLGGPTLGFRRYLSERFGIADMAASSARLCQLVAEAPHDDLIFLGHNGPSGLGAAPGDIWGCDFAPERGDFGDPDLRAAVDHALALGKRVRAVVAGHMHHRLRGGGQRRSELEQGGVLYVNAAAVPRIARRDGELGRHHVCLEIRQDGVVAREVWVPARG
jgi:uncharacterized protein (TIGR04168 family)